MVYREKTTFPAPDGAEERTTYIYLPKSYRAEPDRRYPVLYMFDGHNVFFDTDATYGKSWGMGEYLDRIGAQLIVAGVECNHSPKGGRLVEYSPYSFVSPDFGRMDGLGEATMEWFVDVYKKDIDKRYRTLPDREHTFIAGSSMGGLMSLYAVLKYNSVYSRAAALSPSVWASKTKLVELVRQSEPLPDTVIYMDYGSEELGNHEGMRKKFFDVAAALAAKGIYVTGRIIPYGTHCEASWERQLPLMMSTLLYELKDDDDEGRH